MATTILVACGGGGSESSENETAGTTGILVKAEPLTDYTTNCQQELVSSCKTKIIMAALVCYCSHWFQGVVMMLKWLS